MLVVFLAGTTPPEYIHDLVANHKDGVHPHLKKGEQILMKQHHHCGFLSFTLSPYLSSTFEFYEFETITYSKVWDFPVESFEFHSPSSSIQLRGPPFDVIARL